MSTYGDELSGKVETKGMWGTYDGGLKFIQEGGLDVKAESAVDSSTVAQDYICYTDRKDASVERGSKCGIQGIPESNRS